MKKISGFLASSVFILVSLFCIESAFAGAWTVPKHHVWSEYYMKWNWGKEAFGNNWTKRQLSLPTNGRSWEFVQEAKLEFGVTDSLTALSGIEYKEAHYKEYGRPANWGGFSYKNHGVSAIKVGGRWRFMDAPFVMSTQTKVFIYPGYGINRVTNDPSWPYTPSIGRGDDAVEQRILIGKTFSVPITEKFKLPCYWGAETGYRWRTKGVSGDIPYFVEGGFWPAAWLLVKSELDGYISNPNSKGIEESYGIWRIGGVWQILGGDSVLRQGNKLFNIELQYGMMLWGQNTTAYQEWVCKVQTQF